MHITAWSLGFFTYTGRTSTAIYTIDADNYISVVDTFIDISSTCFIGLYYCIQLKRHTSIKPVILCWECQQFILPNILHYIAKGYTIWSHTNMSACHNVSYIHLFYLKCVSIYVNAFSIHYIYVCDNICRFRLAVCVNLF